MNEKPPVGLKKLITKENESLIRWVAFGIALLVISTRPRKAPRHDRIAEAQETADMVVEEGRRLIGQEEFP